MSESSSPSSSSSSPRAAAAWACLAAAGAIALLLVQLPGFLTGAAVPLEPDINALEEGSRRWFFAHLDALGDGGGGMYPGTHLGVPLWGSPVYALLSPASWLGAVLSSSMALAWGWALHAALCAIGWTLALRRAHPGASPAAIVGPPLLLVACGPVWSFHAVASVDMASLAYVGFAVWALLGVGRRIEVAVDGPSGALVLDALVAGLALAAVFVAGDPFMVPLAAVIGAAMAWPRRFGAEGAARSSTPLSVGAALLAIAAMFLVVTAPLWTEAAAVLPLTERTPQMFSAYEQLAFSTPPARLLEVVSSAFALEGPQLRAALAGSMNDEPWYPHLLLGVVWLGLLVVAALRRPASAGDLRRGERVLLTGALACAVLSLGRYLPGVDVIWTHVPPLSLLRFPERLWRYGVVLCVPALSSGLIGVARLPLERASTATRAALPWLVVVLGLVELVVQTPRPLLREPLRFGPELTDLMPAARAHDVRVMVTRATNLAAQPVRFDLRPIDVPMLRAADPTASPVLKYTPEEEWPDRLALQWLGVSHAIAALGGGAEGVRVAQALGLSSPQALGDTGFALAVIDGDPHPGPRVATLITRAVAGVPYRALLDDPHALVEPRVAVAPFVEQLRRGEFLVDDRFALDDGVVVPAQAPPPRSPEAACDAVNGRAVALEVSDDATHLRATVDVPRGCAVLLSAPWRFLPGWRATVQGAPRRIVAVGSLTLGVWLDAGDARSEVVELRYRPRAPRLLWLPAAGLVGLLVAGLRQAARRGRR